MNYRSEKMRIPLKSSSRFRILSGITYCFLWYFSIVAGFFTLLCPVIPLALISPKMFRKWSDLVFGMWEPYPVALMELFFNVRTTVSGDMIDPSENAIFIMNHRTRLDWNFLWAAVYHAAHPHGHNLKFILKAPIMHVPGPGWVMQTCSFLFIHRNWEKDQVLLGKSLEFLQTSDRAFQVLIFPEGTNLTPNSLHKSHKYADDNHLERYYKVLHPKTTGFAYLASQMRHGGKGFAVYDITIGYTKTLPETEVDVVKGRMPDELYFDIKRYSQCELPEGEKSLKIWLSNIWKEKESKLRRFYISGSFMSRDTTPPDCSEANARNENVKSFNYDKFNGKLVNDIPNSLDVNNKEKARRHYYQPGHFLYLSLIFWTCLVTFFFYLLSNYYFQLWVGFYSILFIFLSTFTKGFHQLIAAYHKMRNKGTVNLCKKFE